MASQHLGLCSDWLLRRSAVAQNGPTHNGVPNPEGDGPPNNGRRLLDNGLAPVVNPVQAVEDEANADVADAIVDGLFSESPILALLWPGERMPDEPDHEVP